MQLDEEERARLLFSLIVVISLREYIIASFRKYFVVSRRCHRGNFHYELAGDLVVEYRSRHKFDFS